MQPFDDSDNSHKAKRVGFHCGGGGDYHGIMNERTTRPRAVAAVVIQPSDRIQQLAEELDHVFDEWRLETKRSIDRFIKSIVGVMLAISMAAIAIITFVLNYASPKAVPAAQPIVIYATPSPGARAP